MFVFGLGLALLVQGLGGAAAKLASGRTDDLAHTALHIASGLAGLIAAGRHSDRAARTFAGAFGVFYLALAALGWFGSAPSAWLHLAVADNVFHTIVGAMTIGVAIWPLRPASGVGVEP